MPSQVYHGAVHDPGFHKENYGLNPSNTSQFDKKKRGQGESNPFKLERLIELHEIHVSPFDVNVQCERIVKYIVEKTGIDASNFAIQRLGQATSTKSFIYFKISTFHFDVYKAIINEELWHPDQTARPFRSTPPKRNENGNYYKNDGLIDSRWNGPFGGRPDSYSQRKQFYGDFCPRNDFRMNSDGRQPSPLNDRGGYNPHSRYFPPPRFNGNSGQYHQPDSRQYNGNNNRNGDYSRHNQRPSMGRGYEYKRETHPNGQHNSDWRDFPLQRDFSDRRDFLDRNSEQQNPFRLNRDNYQHRSTNSIYKI